MGGDDTNFERLLHIQEKSIVAWDRTYEKLTQLQSKIEQECGEWDRQFKELREIVVDRIKADEAFTRWLKIVTAMIGFVSVVIGIVVAIKG